MNLIHSRPPHVRSHESNFSVMGDCLLYTSDAADEL